jgi:Fe-Mn family superoxide dismutase
MTVAPYSLNPLPYESADLVPAVPADWLQRHRDIHHGSYIRRVNTILQSYPQLQGRTVEELLRKIPEIPEQIRDELVFEAGGHADHQFLWKILGPAKQNNRAIGNLAAALTAHFGSFEDFCAQFERCALGLRGHGWAFLSRTAPQGKEMLEILALPGNGSVLPLGKPGILICDMWEHAYEREHGDDRAAWLKSFWQMVNWDECERRLEGLRQGRTHL